MCLAVTLDPAGDRGMAGGQKAPGTQGDASAPGPDQNVTGESTRTPAFKRGPQTTGTTPENPRPPPPSASGTSTGNSSAGPRPGSSTPQGCRTTGAQQQQEPPRGSTPKGCRTEGPAATSTADQGSTPSGCSTETGKDDKGKKKTRRSRNQSSNPKKGQDAEKGRDQSEEWQQAGSRKSRRGQHNDQGKGKAGQGPKGQAPGGPPK